MSLAEIYFHKTNRDAITAILGVEVVAYDGDVMMAYVDPANICKLKDPRYAARCGVKPFAVGEFCYIELGRSSGQETGDFSPRIMLQHPIKGRVRFTTIPESVLLTQGMRTSVERGMADERIVVDADNFIPDAFPAYALLCGGDPQIVVYKLPDILEKEKDILSRSE